MVMPDNRLNLGTQNRIVSRYSFVRPVMREVREHNRTEINCFYYFKN